MSVTGATTRRIAGAAAPRLSALADGPHNNFRVLRLAAATAVILSHAYILNGGAGAIRNDFLERLTGVDSGEFAVDVFFVTSGFLVSRSLLRRRDVVDFIASRVLRITPGLAIAVLVGALILGPAVTELPLRDYFETKFLYSYILIDTVALSPFHMRFALPGVFHDLPMPDVVNAPLWTLPWEIWMYGALLLLFLGRGLGKVFVPLLVVIIAGYVTTVSGLWQPGIVAGLAFRFLAFFFCGTAMQLFAGRIAISGRMLTIVTVIFLAVSVASQSAVLLPPWLAYATMFAAYSPALIVERWSRGPDYSYGMYIYAYMVQQTLVWGIGPHAPLLNALLALLLTLPIAALSWHFVEEPALALKSRFRRARTAPTAVETAW